MRNCSTSVGRIDDVALAVDHGANLTRARSPARPPATPDPRDRDDLPRLIGDRSDDGADMFGEPASGTRQGGHAPASSR